jgi:hypothetical protein
VLLVVRTLVDRLIEALERADEGGGEPDVEDIPIA